jgi:hypothetical protein
MLTIEPLYSGIQETARDFLIGSVRWCGRVSAHAIRGRATRSNPLEPPDGGPTDRRLCSTVFSLAGRRDALAATMNSED